MKTLLTAALVTGLASAASAANFNLDYTEATFASYQSAEAFYGELKDAASDACRSAHTRELSVRAADLACRESAIQSVVEQIDRPQLWAVHGDQS